MKRLVSLLGAAIIAVAASAQITWNAKFGFGASSCVTTGDAKLKEHGVGKLGVGIEYPLTANFSLMPSLEIAIKGAKEENAELTISYLQIPVMGAYRINLSNSWNLTLKVGPYFAYGLSAEMKADGDKIDIFSKSKMSELGYEAGNRLDVGVDVGVDFEYHRLVFGVEYERGFINLFPTGKNFAKVYNQAIYATIGYKF